MLFRASASIEQLHIYFCMELWIYTCETCSGTAPRIQHSSLAQLQYVGYTQSIGDLLHIGLIIIIITPTRMYRSITNCAIFALANCVLLKQKLLLITSSFHVDQITVRYLYPLFYVLSILLKILRSMQKASAA